MFKPNKQVTARRQSTVKNNNDEASPTESELQNKETKSSQTTLERFVPSWPKESRTVWSPDSPIPVGARFK